MGLPIETRSAFSSLSEEIVMPDPLQRQQDVSLGEAGKPAQERHAVSLRNVGKTFDNGTQALCDISLSVNQDEFVAVVGASGCGKSTLLRIVAGLVPSTSGDVEVLGTRVDGPSPAIGLMFQRPALLEWKTALENVLIPVRLRRRINKSDITEAMDWLHLFGLEGFESRFPEQLSGGMQQRVALARLMMTGASVRLLDEPFGAVDELTRERLNEELAKVHEQTRSATVLVTHNIYEAVLVSDRVVVMTSRPGTVAADIPVPLPRPRTLDLVKSPEFQNLTSLVRDALLGSNPHA
jgi:NitT/TauT family transport system ATP-binding protein